MDYTIRVRDAYEGYYDNAKVENSHDALMICKFYRESLGYDVKLFKGDQDVSFLIDSMKVVTVEKGGSINGK